MTTQKDCPLMRSARQTRESARRFAAIVQRFGDEMPGHLDRLHEVLADIRRVANDLNGTPAPAAVPLPASVPVALRPAVTPPMLMAAE